MLYLFLKLYIMSLTKESFNNFKLHQYCDNPSCAYYNKVGMDNIKTHSFAVGQCYCNCCRSGPFSVRKGTMFFGLRTPIDKVIKVLCLLSSGMGQNAICRTEDVTGDSIRKWIVLASKQVNDFTEYMQQGMNLEQVQIDEFWSFVQKKETPVEPEAEKEANLPAPPPQIKATVGHLWLFCRILVLFTPSNTDGEPWKRLLNL